MAGPNIGFPTVYAVTLWGVVMPCRFSRFTSHTTAAALPPLPVSQPVSMYQYTIKRGFYALFSSLRTVRFFTAQTRLSLYQHKKAKRPGPACPVALALWPRPQVPPLFQNRKRSGAVCRPSSYYLRRAHGSPLRPVRRSAFFILGYFSPALAAGVISIQEFTK